MTICISILRGINVSGRRIVKMDALKEMCSELGFSGVQTYIQSGNIVFQTKEIDTGKLSRIIETAIGSAFGFNAPVITLTKEDLENIIQSNPFVNDAKAKTFSPLHLHVTFLSSSPAKENIELLQQTDFKNDRYQIIRKAVYLYCPDGYGNSKFTNVFLENKLKVTATTRNWKTVNELLKIAARIR